MFSCSAREIADTGPLTSPRGSPCHRKVSSAHIESSRCHRRISSTHLGREAGAQNVLFDGGASPVWGDESPSQRLRVRALGKRCTERLDEWRAEPQGGAGRSAPAPSCGGGPDSFVAKRIKAIALVNRGRNPLRGAVREAGGVSGARAGLRRRRSDGPRGRRGPCAGSTGPCPGVVRSRRSPRTASPARGRVRRSR